MLTLILFLLSRGYKDQKESQALQWVPILEANWGFVLAKLLHSGFSFRTMSSFDAEFPLLFKWHTANNPSVDIDARGNWIWMWRRNITQQPSPGLVMETCDCSPLIPGRWVLPRKIAVYKKPNDQMTFHYTRSFTFQNGGSFFLCQFL